MLNFEQALTTVQEKLSAAKFRPAIETLPLERVRGRVLAEDVAADRDYPPFHRSTRDGFAIRVADLSNLPAVFNVVGEVRAGEHFTKLVGPGQCVEIMTGAPLPEGADAVVMVEHVRRDGAKIEVNRALQSGDNVVGKGSEARAGATVLPCGRRLGAGEIGLLATVGKADVRVFARPRVAILPTGDEVVPVERVPEWFQIRNSNAVTLAAQAEAAGGVPQTIGIAPDERQALRRMILEGLEADLLVLSGGISMGKYDLVERVLEELGAEIYFHGVGIRPGKPVVFGRVGEKCFFGLPGNPVSTYVTFEMFVRPAVGFLSGQPFECPTFLRARLGKPFRQKTGLTVFMPARVTTENADPVVNLVGWQGSGDLVGVAAANCFLVVHPDQTDLAAGDWVDILSKEQ